MRRLVCTEIGLLAAFLAGALIAYVGLAVFVSGEAGLVGGGILVLGVWLMLAAPAAHERAHRERGEAGHAPWLWWDDRGNPPWRRTP